MPGPDALAAALLRLSEHAERLSQLDAREQAHHARAAGRIAALTSLADAMKQTLAGQAEILAGLTAFSDSAPGDGDGGELPGYEPGPAPRFWQLDGDARERAVARLRAWVEQVYRPGYGQLAAGLAGCWPDHPLCLYTLDWLSELWSVLYLQPARTPAALAGQGEWQTRLLEAAAGQMARETTRCQHMRTARTGARP